MITHEKVDGYLISFEDEIRTNNTGHIQLTEWVNGEGFDVSTYEEQFSLTHKEWEKLKEIVDKYYKDTGEVDCTR